METQQNQNMNQGSPHQSAGFLKDMENFFYNLYKKVTWHLPPNIKELIVKFAPIIILIIMIFAIPVILVSFGFHALFGPYVVNYGRVHGGMLFGLAGLVSALAFIFNILALPGLFSRSLKGWQMIYYAALLSGLAALLRFDLGGLIIGLALSLYVLFEIKSYYK